MGALLVSAGFLGQAIAAMRSGWGSTAGIVAYVVAAAVIAGGLLSFAALASSPRARSVPRPARSLPRCVGPLPGVRRVPPGIYTAGQTKEDLDKWVAVAERWTPSLAHRADYSRSASCLARARWLRQRGRCRLVGMVQRGLDLARA